MNTDGITPSIDPRQDYWLWDRSRRESWIFSSVTLRTMTGHAVMYADEALQYDGAFALPSYQPNPNLSSECEAARHGRCNANRVLVDSGDGFVTWHCRCLCHQARRES